MQRFIPLSPALVAAAIAFSCAPEPGPVSVAGESAAAVVATIDSNPITQADLDEWIKQEIFEREVAGKNTSEQYEIRSGALQALIDERILEAEAARAGSTTDSVLDEAVAKLGPVSDEEVASFFEEHRSRFRPEDTIEGRGEQIRQFLESERQRKAVTGLRENASVEIALEAPRFEVAATGPSLGPDTAPVTIVEFSDYQCPYCSRAEPILKQVLQKYPDDVRLVFRHLPLDSIHPRARPAAEAAVCAEEQGYFWAFHEKLFANQKQLGDEQLTDHAQALGLDMTAFASCREKDEVKARVESDVQAAEAAGISGTPAFFVNGVMLSGAKPLEAFVEVIEAELRGTSEPANAS